MINSDMPINGECANKEDPAWAAARVGGLTKREHFAGLAMQGLISTSQLDQVAVIAVGLADDLLKELEK